VAQQSTSGLGRLIVEVSRSHTNTYTRPIGLITTSTRDEYLRPHRDSNTRFQQSNGHWDRLAAKSVLRKCIFDDILYVYVRVCMWVVHTHTHTHTHTHIFVYIYISPYLRPFCVPEIVGVNKKGVKNDIPVRNEGLDF
jgi:hypothetical protein